MSHTPGPWNVVRSDRGGWLIRKETGGIVSRMAVSDVDAYQEEADARLMAAAPALLAALEAISDNCRATGNPDRQVREHVLIARAAIRQAKGETK